MSQPFLALASTALLGGWSAVAAQQLPPPPPSFDEALVVTASFDPRPREELVATVDVVESAEIDAAQATLILDLLRERAGLTLVQSGSPGKVASLFTRGTNSAHTRVLFDGIVLNDPVLGAFDWAALGTTGSERIEIARGPFSALWGSSAVGGVVQLLPQRSDRMHVTTSLEAGSESFLRGSLAGAAPLGPLDLAASAQSRRGEGFVENDGFDLDDGSLRVDWRPNDALRVGLFGRAANSESGLPFDFSGQPTPERTQRGTSRLAALPLDFAWRNVVVELRAAKTTGTLDVTDPQDPFAASTAETERRQVRGVVRLRLGNVASVAAGGEWDREEATTGSAFGPGLDAHHQSTRSGFAEGSWALSHARFELGVRHDDHSVFGAETSLRFGSVVAVAEAFRVRASYGESFRAPSLGDLYYPGFGNPELAAEHGKSWELGFEMDRGRSRSRLTGFLNELEDLIQFDLVRFLPRNIGRARTRGIEAESAWHGERWGIRGYATWLEAEDLEANVPLVRRPEWSGGIAASCRTGLADWGLNVRSIGAREDVGRVPLPEATVADLLVSTEVMGGFVPFARVENLFDRRYEETVGVPAPRRSWVVGLRWRAGE